VLTRFSQRYGSGDAQRLAGEAAMAFGGQVVLAHDLTGSPFRPGSRQRPANDFNYGGYQGWSSGVRCAMPEA
jgi:hypothetical protein